MSSCISGENCLVAGLFPFCAVLRDREDCAMKVGCVVLTLFGLLLFGMIFHNPRLLVVEEVEEGWEGFYTTYQEQADLVRRRFIF